MLEKRLKNVVDGNKGARKGYAQNLLKEHLQLLALNFIYNSKYGSLIFKGGSCLRICFGLPRLSEDLDFDYERKLDGEKFFQDIAGYFRKDQSFPELEIKIGAGRCYLKFPILKKLGIVGPSESDKLYLKIEIAPALGCNFETESEPILKQGFSFLARRYSLSSLMAGKINAVLEREWFRGKDNKITIKGRDFFDLYWYLDRGVKPEYDCVFYKSKKVPKERVWELVENRVDALRQKELEYDLLNLVKDRVFVKKFCREYKTLFNKKLESYLLKSLR